MEGRVVSPTASVSAALDRVLDFIDKSPLKHEIAKAREEFFAELDPSLISDDIAGFALLLFQDWFLFERPLEGLGITPVKAFYREFSPALSPEEDVLFFGLTQTVYGVFRLKRIRSSSVVLASLVDKKVFSVFDPVPEGFRTENYISARLVDAGDKHLFCPAVCFHPKSQAENIRRWIEQLKGTAELTRFLLDLAYVNLKTKLYPEVDPDLFYRELFREG